MMAAALHIYADMTNFIVCLNNTQGLKDSFSVSAKTNMGPVGRWAEWGKKRLWVYFFYLSPYVQGKKAVFEEIWIPFKMTELVLHRPDSTINFRCL